MTVKPAGAGAPQANRLEMLAFSDDLTGSAACGAELARSGLEVEVRGWETAATYDGVEALVVDSASRNLSPADAALRMREIVARLDAVPELYYKRIDSGLRGNVDAELQALSDSLARPCLVAPAAPALGTTTTNGRQFTGGVPVTESLYGSDRGRAASAQISEIISRSTDELDLGVVRNAPELALRIEVAASEGRWAICDAQTASDLVAIAAGVARLPAASRPILVGSYGLASAWAHASRTSTPAESQGLLVVTDSLKQPTRAQMLFAVDAGAECVYAEPRSRAISAAVESLRSGRHTIITSRRVTDGESPQDDPRVAPALAATALSVIAHARPAALISIGGDLGSHLLWQAGVSGVRVICEPWPTIPVVRLIGGELDGMPAVVKSGAQANETWLTHALDVLANGGFAARQTAIAPFSAPALFSQ